MKQIALFLFFLNLSSIHSQSTHSNLRNKDDLKRFKEVSQSLVCQCGCKMLLDSCNHSTCLAWSMRSIIDQLILAGYSRQFILNGFESGFSINMLEHHKAFDILKAEQYKDYVSKYSNGFGSSVLSKPKNKQSLISIILASLGIFLTVLLFIYRRKKPISVGSQEYLSNEEKKLYKKLYLDQDD